MKLILYRASISNGWIKVFCMNAMQTETDSLIKNLL